MPAQLHDPPARLLSLLSQPPPQGRWLIGLCGLPGAGKSTVASQWIDQVNERTGSAAAVALSMDGFHLTQTALAQFADPLAAFARRGAPWTFDPHSLRTQLLALRAGSVVSWPGFEHAVGDPVEGANQVGPQIRLALVEGLYLLHDDHGWDVASCFDEHWFLDVGLELAMQRLEARHMAASQQTRAQARARLQRNDRLNAAIAAQASHKAHWLVANMPKAAEPASA